MEGSDQEKWSPAQISQIGENLRALGATPESDPEIFQKIADLLAADDPAVWPILQQQIGQYAEEAADRLGNGGEAAGGDTGPAADAAGAPADGPGGQSSDAAGRRSNADRGKSANDQGKAKTQPQAEAEKQAQPATTPTDKPKKSGADKPAPSGTTPDAGKSAAPGGGPAPKPETAGGSKPAGGATGGSGAVGKAEMALQAIELAKTAKEQGAGAAAKQAAGIGVEMVKQKILIALLTNVWFWIILAAIIVLILLGVLIYTFMVFAGKVTDLAGGSEIIQMEYPRHNALQQSVMAAVGSEKIVFADNRLMDDIKWKTRTVQETDPATNQVSNKQEQYMVLDWRTMVTLDYLAKKWDRIRVSILYSNGPDFTRRKAVWKVGSIDTDQINKFYRLMVEKDMSVFDEAPITTISGYKTGQALGIDQIGWTSPALTAACFGGIKKPVQVGWQRIIRLEVVRPLYEQMQIDGYDLYSNLTKLKALAVNSEKSEFYAQKTAEQSTAEDSWDNLSVADLDQLINNLTKATLLISLDIRAIGYFGKAKAALVPVRELIKSKSGVERVKLWADDEKVRQPILNGLWWVYRGMQVANMGKWRGSITAGLSGAVQGGVVGAVRSECKFWKAYEARMNVRQLTLDMLQLPFDPAYAAPNQQQTVAGIPAARAAPERQYNDNPVLQVKQLIVYSPEDDLDNGISEFDVYPNGAISVNEGGVGYDASGRDGVIDWRDLHFMAPPVDVGVFSKPGTIFVYKTDSPNFHGVFASVKTLWDGLGDWADSVFDDIWTGAGMSYFAGEDVEKVSYRNFVHIGY